MCTAFTLASSKVTYVPVLAKKGGLSCACKELPHIDMTGLDHVDLTHKA